MPDAGRGGGAGGVHRRLRYPSGAHDEIRADVLSETFAQATNLLHGGSPVVDGGRVIMALADFGDGARGGVIALDAATGELLWEYRAGFGVRSAPAVSGTTLVLAGNAGTVHALDSASGTVRWQYRLAEGI